MVETPFFIVYNESSRPPLWEIGYNGRKDMKKIGIVICNYNKSAMLKNCIQAVLENTFTDFDVYVVDNGSEDDSVQMVRETYISEDASQRDPRVHLIENQENLGGSGGFNTGLRTAYNVGYPYLMCIDNDAYLDERAIQALYVHMEQHPDTGMAASKIYHLEEPDYVQNFGQHISFDGFYTEVEYLNALEDGSMPEVNYSDGVPACSLMIRREVIGQIGFLPEENFLYWDDTEWCYLCNKMGWKVASVGASQALHSMGAKKEDVNTFPTYYAWRNWIRFFIKYTPEEKLLDMAGTFLNSVFQVQYEGYLTDQYCKADTVMAAYDDALHDVNGKAGMNRIFDIDHNYKQYKAFLEAYKVVYLDEQNMPLLSEKVQGIWEKANCQNPKFIPIDEADILKKHEIRETEQVAVLHLCHSVLSENVVKKCAALKDPERHYFLDENDCLVKAIHVRNVQEEYKKAREIFVFSQLPLFIRQADKIRNTIARLSKD